MSRAKLTDRTKPLLWLRRLADAQRLRLASGLVLFIFAVGHFFNLALGLVSIDVMEAVEYYRWWVWHTWIGTILLYGAFGVHIIAGLWKLVWRATWRMPAAEALQIVLGLAIPYFLIDHILATRVMAGQFGFHDSFVNVLRGIWPGLAWSQSALLLIVWGHACIGLDHWLRLKPFYARGLPWLIAGAVLLPTLALAGWISAGRAVALMTFTEALMTPSQRNIFEQLKSYADIATAVALSTLIVGFALTMIVRRVRASLTVTYPNGRRLRARPGATLLEIARANGEPHAAICGGRARCTTCRVQVVSGGDDLVAPSGAEAVALARIGAPADVRLACQIRPRQNVTVRPLVPVAEAPASLRADDPYRWGVERRVSVMFTDLRGFTTLAEQLYPYDAVFLLNRYFEVMSGVVRAHGGLVDKFLGDGIMALFGLDASQGAGSRDALRAAAAMAEALDNLNLEFAATIPVPLRMGVGVHMGPAVLGRVGASGAAKASGMALTALGDTVNTASRLESMNKEHGSFLVVSDQALKASRLSLTGAVESLEVPVRGRSETLVVHIVRSFKDVVLRDIVPDTSAPLASADAPSTSR
jgi:adenylate cyclase